MSDASDVQGWLIRRIAVTFNLSPSRLDGDTLLDDVGMDSITRASLAVEIHKTFGVPLDPESMDEFPTLQALADRIAAGLVAD